MAKLKVLKDGETDINSTDISKFAMHSDYKCQKVASQSSADIVMPEGSVTGDVATGVIYHNLGYIPPFFVFVEHNNKGYEAVGNANPLISVQSMQFFWYSPKNDTIGAVVSRSSGTNISSNVSVNDIVRLYNGDGTMPSPLSEGVNYYVKSIVDSSRFTISTTIGGSTIDILSDGTSVGSDIFENITNPRFGDLRVGFNISADSTKLNIQAYVAGLFLETYKDETFTIRAYFVRDEII